MFGEKSLFILPLKFMPRKRAREIVTKKMSIRAMKSFVYKMVGKNIQIMPYYNKAQDFVMLFISPNCIAINDNYLKRKRVNLTEIKGSLLHELGHMCHRHKKSSSVSLISKQEFEAQLWAYKKAEKLGLKKIMQFLYNDIVDWSKTKKRGIVFRACKLASKKWSELWQKQKNIKSFKK